MLPYKEEYRVKGLKSNKLMQFAIVALVLIAGMSMFNDFMPVPKQRGRSLLSPERAVAKPGVSGGVVGMKKVLEAHWQGMEVVPLTWELAAKLDIPLNEKGVLVDEVTLYAAQSGLRARDVIKSINGVPVTSLEEFYGVTKRLRNSNKAVIDVRRGQGRRETVEFVVPDVLGFAQLESAPMILAGDIAPHRYRGPCTDCHEIGSTGQLTPDPDAVTLAPPPISRKTGNPHRNRGKCTRCHVVKG